MDIYDDFLAFLGGMSDKYQAFSGSANKAFSKGADFIGWDSGKRFFDENVNLANLNRKHIKSATERAPIIAGIGNLATDPLTYVSGGNVIKGSKNAINTIKAMGKGAVYYGGESLARDYGDSNVTAKEMLKRAGTNAGIGAIGNGIFSSRAVDTAFRNIYGKIRPLSKTAENGIANINARNQRWLLQDKQRELLKQTPFLKREVAIPFYRPTNSQSKNQILNNIFDLTNNQKSNLANQNPNLPLFKSNSFIDEVDFNMPHSYKMAKTREALNDLYFARLRGETPQNANLNTQKPQPPFKQNANLANQSVNNPKFVNLKSAFINPNLAVNTAYYGTSGAIGAYNSDNPYLGFLSGIATAYGLKHGGKKVYNYIDTRIPLKNTDEALQKGYANLSYETRMSDKIPQLKKEYQALGNKELANNLDNAIADTNGVKKLLHNLGLKHKDVGVKDGFYENISNPSRQIQIRPEYDKNGNLTQNFIDKMNLASAVIGKSFKQDSVGWHIPNTKANLNEMNAVSVNLGREINANELNALNNALGNKGYGLIPDPNGTSVRIIDFSGNPLKSDDIINSLNKNGYNIDTKQAIPFKTQGDLIAGKWVGDNSVYSNKGYGEQIGRLSDDIYGNSIIRNFGSIGERFSGEYGTKKISQALRKDYTRQLESGRYAPLEAKNGQPRQQDGVGYTKPLNETRTQTAQTEIPNGFSKDFTTLNNTEIATNPNMKKGFIAVDNSEIFNPVKQNPQSVNIKNTKSIYEQAKARQNPQQALDDESKLVKFAKNQLPSMVSGSMVGMAALPSDGSWQDRLRNAAIGGLGFSAVKNANKMKLAMQKSNLEKVKANFDENSDEYLNALLKYEQDTASNGFKDISASNNVLVNTFRDMRKLFSNTMSKEVNDLKDIVATRTNKTSQRISQLEKGLRENFSEQERKAMGRWLQGDESVDLEHFTEQTKKFLQNIKKEINENNQKLVELEHIDQKTADEFKDIYLTRRYEKTANKVNDFFNSTYGVNDVKQRGKSEWVSLRKYDEMKANGEIAEYGDGGFSRGGKYVVDGEPEIKVVRNENGDLIMQERIKIRRDYTPQEREAMGEITDIAELLPKTLYKQNETIAHIEYLNALKTYGKGLQTKNPLARQIFLDTSKFGKNADIDKIAEQQGFKKLNNKHFGPLNGEYVRKDVADDLQATYDKIANQIFGVESSTLSLYKDMVQSWKKSKTVYNPKAHFNNIVSNQMLMLQYGLKPATPQYFNKIKNADRYLALKQKIELGKFKANEMQEFAKLHKDMKTYNEAMELGLFGRGEIQDLQSDMIKNTINKTVGKVSKNSADKWNSANAWAEKWYQQEDHICRLSAYEQLKAKILKGANRELTQAEKQEIRSQVLDIFPDYTRAMPKGIRALRDTGLVPFISWSYYVLPKMVKQMNTPKGAATFAGILGAYYTGMSLMQNYQGIEAGDDISDNAGKYIPLFKPFGEALRGDKNSDIVTRVKVDRAIPQLEFARSPANMAGSMLKSPLVQGVNDVIKVSEGKHPVQLFNNMPITRDSKPFANRVYDYAKYGANTYLPIPQYLTGAYNVAENRLMPQERRRTNNVYVPRSFLQEILNLVGVNTSNYSISGARAEAERRRQRNQ